jgi:ribosomal protein S12 methylthiotransferase accessory factor
MRLGPEQVRHAIARAGARQTVPALSAVGADGETVVIAERPGAADVELLRASLAFGLEVEFVDMDGVWLAMAITGWAANGIGETVTATGKGTSAGQALWSCIGEAVEFHSWVYRPARDDPDIVAAPRAGERVLRAAEVLGLAETPAGALPSLATPAAWTQVLTIGNETAWCPAFLCYGRYGRQALGDASLESDSSGLAAGRSIAEARLNGLLEAVERDATSLWWHRAIARPRLVPAHCGDARLAALMDAHAARTGRECRVLDLTTDIGLPVAAAISSEVDGTLIAMGFACRPAMAEAAFAAFLEMRQMEFGVAQLAAGIVSPKRLAAAQRWHDAVSLSSAPHLRGEGETAARVMSPQTDTEAEFDRCVSALVQLGLEVWFKEFLDSRHRIPVVKAVVLGLAQMIQGHASQRLRHIPAKLKWRSCLPEARSYFLLPISPLETD